MYCEGTRKVFHGGEAPGLCFEMQFYPSALMSHSTLIDTGTVHKASGKKKIAHAHTLTRAHTFVFLINSHLKGGGWWADFLQGTYEAVAATSQVVDCK